MESKIKFANDEKGLKMLSVFIAQLVREQVTYRVTSDDFEYEVTLTGGF